VYRCDFVVPECHCVASNECQKLTRRQMITFRAFKMLFGE
jgi:hypothetical protein